MSGLINATKQYTENNNDMSLFNVNEMRDYGMNGCQDISISLEKTFFPYDIQQFGCFDDNFDSEGYMEDDDEYPCQILGDNQGIRANAITANMDINKVLYYPQSKNKYILDYSEVDIEEKPVQVIKRKDMIVILKYFFEQLDAGLIELSDNFTEERRKYFQKDNNTYITIIKHFLEKKDEFFACVLNDIMNKLNIQQVTIDTSFHYYLELADSKDKIIANIRKQYSDLYSAGVK